MQIRSFYDSNTSTLTYVVWDEETNDAVVIDPVLDFDPVAVSVSTQSVEAVAQFIDAQSLRLHACLETHVHADHLSGAQQIKARYGVPVVIGDGVRQVQAAFKDIFGLDDDFPTDGRQFDRLVGDGEILQAGSLSCTAIHTPGHTPSCVTWRIGDALFTGDAMFMPDFGTGRCDFPGGDAAQLYGSVHDTLYRLPPQTRIFVGHDYQPGGRDLRFETTVGDCMEANKHLRAATGRDEFVSLRTGRDLTLSLPRLLFQSVQVNIRAGHLPDPDAGGKRFFKIPIEPNE